MKHVAFILASILMISFGVSNAEAHPRHHIRHHHIHTDKIPTTVVNTDDRYPNTNIQSGYSGGLVSIARSYMGSNPTGRRRLWCAAFIAKIAPNIAAKVSNPNMAKSYLQLPHVSAQVGALAVLGRRHGGHIGIVTGFDSSGNPTIVSGNHGHKVGEGTYAKGRVIAYVSAS